MAYSGKTRFYNLPYMMMGDYVTEADEERFATIIDNLMWAATLGAAKAIIEDASYTLSDETLNPAKVTLTSPGGEYTFVGIANYRLVYQLAPIELEFAPGAVYYVYCFAGDNVDYDPTNSQIIVSETPIDSIRHLLLCTLDYTGTTAILDTETGKQYMANLAAHTMDHIDPHGTQLYQSLLNVTKALVLGKTTFMEYVIHEIPSSTGATPTIVQIDGFTPKFVSAMSSDFNIGNIATVINSDGTISVTNSGATGLKITLKIEGNYDS